jgi:hypothetical protein
MKKDKLIEFEEKTSVLPMLVSETGDPDKPLSEIIVCSGISGGADYIYEMPRTLTLKRKLANGKEYKADYIILFSRDQALEVERDSERIMEEHARNKERRN